MYLLDRLKIRSVKNEMFVLKWNVDAIVVMIGDVILTPSSHNLQLSSILYTNKDTKKLKKIITMLFYKNVYVLLIPPFTVIIPFNSTSSDMISYIVAILFCYCQFYYWSVCGLGLRDYWAGVGWWFVLTFFISWPPGSQ